MKHTINQTTARKYFSKQAAIKCLGCKGQPCYNTYFKLCIEGLAHKAGFYITKQKVFYIMQYKKAWDMELQEWVIVRPWMKWNSDTWTKGYKEEFWINLSNTYNQQVGK